MNGLDTNVLLRLFTSDQPHQTSAVLRLLAGCGPASMRVTNIVLVELSWTLTRRYKVKNEQLIDILERMLMQRELVFESRSAVMTAVHWLSRGRADFPDYLMAALNEEAGASPTYTFDQDAASHYAFELVQP